MAEIIWESELGPSWPSDWSHTTVHAQFVAVTGDGADTDRLPDIAPSGNGEVVFTPSLRTVRYVGADGPYVVSLKQYRAVVDSEGYLCTPDTFGQPGERGIVLPSTDAPVIEPRGEDDNAFTWRVDFDLPAVTIRSDHIAVPVGGPYNLVDLLSPERAAGVVHVIDRVSARPVLEAAQEATAARDLVLPARDQTLTARDEVLAHGAPVIDTSVGTRIFVGDTMIYGDTGWRDISHLLEEDWVLGANRGRVNIRRINSTIHLDLRVDRVTEGGVRASTSRILAAPAGFRATSWSNVLGDAELYDLGQIGRVNAMGTVGTINVENFSGTWGEGDRLFLIAQWETPNSWPANPQGTPA